MTVTLYVELKRLEDFVEFLAVTDAEDMSFSKNILKEYITFARPTNGSLTWVQVNLDNQEWGKVYNHLLD